MILELQWQYARGEFETKKARLIALPAHKAKGHPVSINLQPEGEGMNFGIIDEVNLGQTWQSTNDAYKLACEICRRFNEFPEKEKQ